MKKRLPAVILALALCLGLCAPAFAAEPEFVIEHGVLTKYNGSGGNVAVPGGVAEIGLGAFAGCTGLTGVTIPSSVVKIHSSAFFECHSLKDVYFGGSETQWNALTIEMKNESLQAASIHYNSSAPAFTDTPAWCSAEAQWAVEQGITNGAGNDALFAPALECTHDQILTFLWRAAGKPDAEQAPVTAASYYQDAVNWAYEKGFIGDSFRASAPCTRVQAVWYIWVALDEPQAAQAASFSDVEANSPYLPAVSWALEKEVTKGYGGEDTFAPDQVCSRGEIACFLYRAFH